MKARRKSKRRRVTRDVEREFNRHMQAVLRAMREGFGTGGPSFEDAVNNLRRQVIARGGDGTLRDCQCFLCEDGRSAVLYADWGSDQTVCATFMLPVTEREFDGEAYVRRCEG